MTSVDNNEPELGGDDLIAAEYVLGVLSAEERAAATRRIEADAAFQRLVDHWEGHFSPMAAAYDAVEPPAALKAAIDRRLFSNQTEAERAPAVGFWSSIAVWRTIAAAAIAALALYIAIPLINPTVESPQNRYVASLAADGSDVHYFVIYDAASGEVSLSHVSGARAAGHDFELWVIEGQNAPVSIGVIPVGATTHVSVKPQNKTRLDAGAVLAVSLEPTGGSPTGQPTGPVVATGDLKNI
jgi:anti-sigma-K factor RskA